MGKIWGLVPLESSGLDKTSAYAIETISELVSCGRQLAFSVQFDDIYFKSDCELNI